MTYTLTKSQKFIQKSALEFAKGEFAKEDSREFEQQGRFPAAIWRKAAELGFIGIHLPEACGGGAMGAFENVLVAEALAGRDSTTGAAVMLTGVAAEWLAGFGTSAQQGELLPAILEGRMLPGVFLAPAMIDLSTDAILLQGTESEGEWRLTGPIDNVINAAGADIYFVLGALRPAAGAESELSMLAVTNTEKVAIEAPQDMLGLRMTGVAQLRFDDARLPRTHIIGKQNTGLLQTKKTLPGIHLLLAALALGTAQGAFDKALVHTKGREQFGRSIAGFEVTRHKLVEMALQIEQARCLTYQTALQHNAKKSDLKMATMANLAANRAAVAVSYEAIQLLGGYGFTTEYDVERCYRDAKTLQLLSGHGNELKETVAASIVGKLKR